MLALCLLPCACTVKENRSICPCDLLILPEGPVETAGSVLVSIVQDGTLVGQEMLSREEFEAGGCRITVNRGPTKVTVFTGITSMNLLQGRKLDIRSEHQCDELFSCSDDAELDGDNYEYPVSLHKNFARLYLTVLNIREGMNICVNGSVSGYDLLNASPCEGCFSCPTENVDAAQGCCIRLPRQKDDSLVLDIEQEGETVRSVPLGALIESTGYSFEDEDLMDIAMTVDLEKSYASLSVLGWKSVTFPKIEF